MQKAKSSNPGRALINIYLGLHADGDSGLFYAVKLDESADVTCITACDSSF